MTDTDALRRALANLADAHAAQDSDLTDADADAVNLARADVLAECDAAGELLDDRECVMDAQTDDDPARWLSDEALRRGGRIGGREALRLVLIAERAGTAPAPELPELPELAAAEVEARRAEADRAERLALLDPGDGAPARQARAELAAVRTLQDRVAGAGTGARRAVPAKEIVGTARPDRLLSLAGHGGALLSEGGVALLAGEGGVAKSPLALSIAAGFAAHEHGGLYGGLHGGLFDGAAGPVLVASYEDPPSVAADRLQHLARKWWPAPPDPAGLRALADVHLLDLAGAPLFGPVAVTDDRPALYNARPGPLAGWRVLWNEAHRIGARLVVIDPALAAYAADANGAAQVREFMGALAAAAAPDPAAAWRGCGVLMVAHSTKAARGGPARKTDHDPFDPGQVAGSSHWTDAARGVLTLTFDGTKENAPGARVLAVSKANYGPARLLVSVDPDRNGHGEIVGFTNAAGSGGGWQTLAEHKEAAEAAKANGAGGKVPAGVDTSEA